MKYFFYAFLFVLLATSCSSDSENTMNLSGEIKGLKKGTIYLQKFEDTLMVSVDSLIVDGSSAFQFSEVIKSPEMYYLALTFKDSSNVIKRVPFFAEPGTISVHSTLKNYERDVKVTGSANHEKWAEHGQLIKRYQDKNLDLIQESLNALKDGNDSLTKTLENRQDKLVVGKYLATVNYALNHSDYEVAPYLMLTEVYDAHIKYMDTIYGALTPKVKDSKYGKALESFIKDRKN